MKIYEFSTWFTKGRLFSVQPIEVEEKPKTYVGNHTRINKDEINRLSHSMGHRMYCLDDNPTRFIAAMIEAKKKTVEGLTVRLENEKIELQKWITEQQEMEKDK